MNGIVFPDHRELDFVALGRVCVDLNANERNRPMEETVTFTKYVGGSPANITIALARLGMRTGFIGKIADDALGRFIRSYLERMSICTDNLVTDHSGAVTGLALTEIKSPTDCSILMYREHAADLELRPDEVQEEMIAKSRALLISGTALAKSPSREAVFQALAYARKHKTVTILDIDYRAFTWQSLDEASIYCNLAAAQCDILLGGREEFDLLERTSGPRGEGDDATASHWFAQGAQLVVVKHGGHGSVVFTPDGGRHQGGIFPAKQMVKTFGAGDAYAGAFIYSLFEGKPLTACQQYGSAAASIVVSSHSCSDAMPTVEQIDALIAEFRSEEGETP